MKNTLVTTTIKCLREGQLERQMNHQIHIHITRSKVVEAQRDDAYIWQPLTKRYSKAKYPKTFIYIYTFKVIINTTSWWNKNQRKKLRT